MWRILPVFLAGALAAGERVTVSLNGEWEIADSLEADRPPARFAHRVPVPGLVHLAHPPFPDVDRFDSRELINNRIRRKMLPESARVSAVGVSRQNRNYFWYRRSFRVPVRKPVAILRVAKAQFGTAVWLNGKKIGEHLPCFSAGYFDLTGAMDWQGDNLLLIRVGAHPAVLPPSVPAGTDFEKLFWTPGIYDEVSLALSDNPVIESVQVAPRIAPPRITVETRLRNYAAAASQARLVHRVQNWRAERTLRLAPGEERAVTLEMALPGAKLWSPEQPALYTLESSTGGDSIATRFGVREIRFDTATRRAYLNGQVYFLRGSNITLHRFFEDPKSGALPWNEAWVRKLLIEIPRKMKWNTFRFCIGPAPDKWFDIADEAGLLIQNEFFIWTGPREWHAEWTEDELVRQYSEWMRDHWNHPSVALWDAANETIAPVLGEKVIPRVRALDLSNRAWENGYNLPAGPDDPYEDHPYLFSRVGPGRADAFRVADLETLARSKQPNAAHPTAHAAILNEYGWLWLNRDGAPTVLTKEVYETLLGPGSTADQRFSLYAYLLGGLTEFWRSRRDYAGVLHFVYLTASFPEAYTSDHFRDVEKLELEPHFADYLREAFRPLGVYLNFWQEELKGGERRRFAVSLVNDDAQPAEGRLALTLEDSAGRAAARGDTPFAVPANGQHTVHDRAGDSAGAAGGHVLKAAASPAGGRHAAPTVSRRRVRVRAE